MKLNRNPFKKEVTMNKIKRFFMALVITAVNKAAYMAFVRLNATYGAIVLMLLKTVGRRIVSIEHMKLMHKLKVTCSLIEPSPYYQYCYCSSDRR